MDNFQQQQRGRGRGRGRIVFADAILSTIGVRAGRGRVVMPV